MSSRRTRFVLGVFVAVFALSTTAQLFAFHQWGCYKWAWTPGSSTSLDLGYAFGQMVSGRDYLGAYLRSRSVWNTAPPINVFQVSSGNKLTWYAKNYGVNGWLGLAQIWVNGCTIVKGTSKLNNTYLRSGFYSQTAIDHVACQEVGHTFGLDHNHNETNTCMNDGILTAGAQINQHDRDQILAMYP